MPVAEKCLTWIDKYGDRDGDGFQEYQTRSKAGAYNQGWKDSGQALVNTDGSIVKTPIALVEIQGYVYDAWLRMAQIYDALGKSARARTLRRRPRPCSSASTTRFGTKSQASTLSASMATKSGC